MAFTDLGTLGSNGNKTAGNSLAITTSAAANVGDLVIVQIATDNAANTTGATTTHSTLTAGTNTFVKIGEQTIGGGGVAGGVTLSVWRSVLTQAIALGSVITAGFSFSPAAKGMSGRRYSAAGALSFSAAVSGSATGAPTSLTVSGLTAGNNHLAYRSGAAETKVSSFTAATAGWTLGSDIGSTGSGGDATHVSVMNETLMSTGVTSYTSQPTGSSFDRSSIMFVVSEAVAASTPLTVAGANSASIAGALTQVFGNTGFDSDTIWTKGGVSTTISGGKANAVGEAQIVGQSALTVGVQYEASFDYVTTGSAIRLRLNNSQTNGAAILQTWGVDTNQTANPVKWTFIAADPWLFVEADGGGFTGTIDNFTATTSAGPLTLSSKTALVVGDATSASTASAVTVVAGGGAPAGNPNLLVNGSFDTDLTGFIAGGADYVDANKKHEWAAPGLMRTTVLTAPGYRMTDQTVSGLTIGATYLLKGDVKAISRDTAPALLAIGGGNEFSAGGTGPTGFSFVATATSHTVQVGFRSTTEVNDVVDWDDLGFYLADEVPGQFIKNYKLTADQRGFSRAGLNSSFTPGTLRFTKRAAGDTYDLGGVTVRGLTVGTVYEAKARVRQGSARGVGLSINGGSSSLTLANDQIIVLTFTATATEHYVQFGFWPSALVGASGVNIAQVGDWVEYSDFSCAEKGWVDPSIHGMKLDVDPAYKYLSAKISADFKSFTGTQSQGTSQPLRSDTDLPDEGYFEVYWDRLDNYIEVGFVRTSYTVYGSAGGTVPSPSTTADAATFLLAVNGYTDSRTNNVQSQIAPSSSPDRAGARTIGIAYSLTLRKMWLLENGVALSGDPVARTGGAAIPTGALRVLFNQAGWNLGDFRPKASEQTYAAPGTFTAVQAEEAGGGSTALVPAASASASSTSGVTLATKAALVVGAAASASQAGSVVIAPKTALVPAAASSASQAGSVTLAAKTALVPATATSASQASAVAIGPKTGLVVGNAVSASIAAGFDQGANLIINGDGSSLTGISFNPGTDGHTLTLNGGRIRITVGPGGVSGFNAAAGLPTTGNQTLGASYRFTGTIWASQSGRGRVQPIGLNVVTQEVVGFGPTSFDLTYIANNVGLDIQLGAASGGAWADANEYAEFDDITLREQGVISLASKTALVPASASSSSSADNVTLAVTGGTITLGPAAAASAASTGNVVLTPKTGLAIQSASSASKAGIVGEDTNVPLSAKTQLAPAAAVSGSTAENVALTVKTALAPAAAVSAGSATSVSLAPKTPLAPAAASSASTTPNVTLVPKTALVVGSAQSASSADAPTLAAKATLAPAAAQSASIASAVALAPKTALIPAAATSASTADSVPLSSVGTLGVAAATSSSVASSPAITPKIGLAPQPAASLSQAGDVLIIPRWTLAVQSASSPSEAGAPVVIPRTVIAPQAASSASIAQSVTLASATGLAVQAAVSASIAGTSALTYRAALLVDSALSGSTLPEINLAPAVQTPTPSKRTVAPVGGLAADRRTAIAGVKGRSVALTGASRKVAI